MFWSACASVWALRNSRHDVLKWSAIMPWLVSDPSCGDASWYQGYDVGPDRGGLYAKRAVVDDPDVHATGNAGWKDSTGQGYKRLAARQKMRTDTAEWTAWPCSSCTARAGATSHARRCHQRGLKSLVRLSQKQSILISRTSIQSIQISLELHNIRVNRSSVFT